jgi:hypothetical protein
MAKKRLNLEPLLAGSRWKHKSVREVRQPAIHKITDARAEVVLE